MFIALMLSRTVGRTELSSGLVSLALFPVFCSSGCVQCNTWKLKSVLNVTQRTKVGEAWGRGYSFIIIFFSQLGKLTVNALETPCHTTGHICYYVHSEDLKSKTVFTGNDCLARQY